MNRDLPSNRNIAGIVVAVVLLVAAGMWLYESGYLEVLVRLFGDPEYIQQTVEPYHELGVLMLLALQILNIVFAPIPGQAIGVAYGLVYGVWWGTLFGMIGTTMGTIIAILVAKRYGQPVVVRVIGEERFQKYNKIIESTDVWPFVILIVLPVIPDDAIAYLAGLTTIRTRRLIIWLAIARFPGMLSLTWFGEGVATADYYLLGGLTLVITLVSLWVIWRREWIIQTLSE